MLSEASLSAAKEKIPLLQAKNNKALKRITPSTSLKHLLTECWLKPQ